MENVKHINKQLRLLFGEENGHPRFRLVWSEGLTEKRYGTFDKFHGKLWVCQWTGVKETKKYSWLKDRWILERYTPTQKLAEDIRKGDNYEPRWVFVDKDGNYLKPIWKVVEIICKTVLDSESGNVQKRTQQMDLYDYEKGLDQEVLKFMEILDIDSGSTSASAFMAREALILPGKEINFKGD